jgi:hypothetical protein
MIAERDEEMRVKYHDPIEQFPNKIDQLFDALDRVCTSFILFSVLGFFVYLDLYGSAKVFIARKVKK